MSSERILTTKPPDADQRVPYGSDPNQFVDVRIPAGKPPYPAVLFIHGGFWRAKYDLAHAGHLCEALRKSGLATWNVEYRRSGNPGGGWPGTLEDIRIAYSKLLDHARQPGARIDPKRICVAGHSAGGHLAFCLAAYEKSVTKALSLAGVLDLQRAWDLHLSNDAVVEFLGGSPLEIPSRYQEASPLNRNIPQARQILIHGAEDTIVPHEIGKRYAETKQSLGERVEWITPPATGHFEIIDPGSAVWNTVQTAFLSLTQ